MSFFDAQVAKAEMQQRLYESQARFERERQSMMGLGGVLAGLGQQQAYQPQLQQAGLGGRAEPKVKYKHTIKAGDNIRDVLQDETDEWLKEIKC